MIAVLIGETRLIRVCGQYVSWSCFLLKSRFINRHAIEFTANKKLSPFRGSGLPLILSEHRLIRTASNGPWLWL
jgi:hypothetical protein